MATVQVLLLAHEDKSLPYFRGNKRALVHLKKHERGKRRKKEKEKKRRRSVSCELLDIHCAQFIQFVFHFLFFLLFSITYTSSVISNSEGGEKEEKQFHLGNIERDLCELFIYSLDVFFHDRCLTRESYVIFSKSLTFRKLYVGLNYVYFRINNFKLKIVLNNLGS